MMLIAGPLAKACKDDAAATSNLMTSDTGRATSHQQHLTEPIRETRCRSLIRLPTTEPRNSSGLVESQLLKLHLLGTQFVCLVFEFMQRARKQS